MAFYTKRSGVTNHPETTLLQEFTDLVKRGGVVSLDRDHLKVTQRSAGANMSVDINKGDDNFGSVYLKRSGNCYPAYLDAAHNIAIDSNTSGNPRIDAVVAYADLVATPGSTNQGNDVAKFIVVKGTPAASPVAPSSAAIEAAIGASDPYEVLAHVTVADSASAIADANISDQRRRVYFKSTPPLHEIDFSASFGIDLQNSSQQEITLTANATPTEPTNMDIGEFLILDIIQGGSGSYTMGGSWWTGIKWPGGSAPSLSTTAGLRDTFIIRKTSATRYEGAVYAIGVSQS